MYLGPCCAPALLALLFAEMFALSMFLHNKSCLVFDLSEADTSPAKSLHALTCCSCRVPPILPISFVIICWHLLIDAFCFEQPYIIFAVKWPSVACTKQLLAWTGAFRRSGQDVPAQHGRPEGQSAGRGGAPQAPSWHCCGAAKDRQQTPCRPRAHNPPSSHPASALSRSGQPTSGRPCDLRGRSAGACGRQGRGFRRQHPGALGQTGGPIWG